VIPCRKASELMSRGMDEPLSWWCRLLLGIHFLYCTACRRFSDHLKVLRGASRSSLADGDETLSPEARERINKAVEKDV